MFFSADFAGMKYIRVWIVIFMFVVSVCLSVSTTVHAGPMAYMGLFVDENHSVNEIWNPGGFLPFTLWTWVLPSDKGMMCAEYKVVSPPNIIVSFHTTHPDVSVYLGDPVDGEGVSVCYNSCRTEWTWTFQVQLYITDTSPSYIELQPHDAWGGPQVANCIEPDYPIEPAAAYSNVCVNTYCYTPPQPPRIMDVTPNSFTSLDVAFDHSVDDWGQDWPEHFCLYDRDDVTDTLAVVEAVHHDITSPYFTLTLGKPMVELHTYLLEATGICYMTAGCADSDLEFLYDPPTATMLESWAALFTGKFVEVSWRLSSVDGGVEPAVMRSESGGGFIDFGQVYIERDGLEFILKDGNIYAGKEYIYRVGYSDYEGFHELFETGVIEVPAAELKLEQNYPNPFNPVTEISFYLPEGGPAALEILDVTGSRIRKLVSGYRDSGPHTVTWDGLDEMGLQAASGVYFYRLTLGKETVSRKMVLMR